VACHHQKQRDRRGVRRRKGAMRRNSGCRRGAAADAVQLKKVFFEGSLVIAAMSWLAKKASFHLKISQRRLEEGLHFEEEAQRKSEVG